MKPHIRKEHSLTYRRPMWVCRGLGCRGMADTPRDAYWDWKYQVNKKAGV